ncbi:MAG: diguanylate cyclase [Steroidobacteraceae bacterium]
MDFLRQLIETAPEGIVICTTQGEDHPVVYANAAFERLTGFTSAELIGTDLRRLQGGEREQEGRTRLRDALQRGDTCRALVHNYRKDGSAFWNEVLLGPLRDGAGQVSHIVGFHRDLVDREIAPQAGAAAQAGAAPPVRAPVGLPTWQREDRLSGLCSRAYFEELLQHDWNVGQREGRMLTLMLFDVEELNLYNDTFGRAAGDACIRRVAGVVGAAFKRGSDVVARWEGGCLCALVRNPDPTTLASFGAAIQQRVLGQRIHHPRAHRQKFVSVSVGVATLNPASDRPPQLLISAAQTALTRAKKGGGPPLAVATPEELEARP